MGGVEYQVTKVDPTNPETKGMVYQVHKVTEEVAATLGGKVYRARIINDPTEPTVVGKVYQIVLIDDPTDPSVKGKVYNAILTGGSEAVVVGPAVSPLSLPDAAAEAIDSLIAYGGIEQRNLPDGYTQLEYIESTGTQYIDPQVTGNARWVITAQANAVKGSSQSLISSTDGTQGGSWYGEFTSTGKWDIVSGGTNIPVTTKTTADLTFDGDGVRGTIGSTSVSRSVTVTQGTWHIFATTDGSYSFAGKLFDAKVYQGGVLVRNFVPAKDSNNVVGLYDTVSGTFFTNDGTGDFVAGSAVLPTPNTPMDIVSNNGVLKARHQSGLPLGYTLLEYIESTGTQWIDTGVTNENCTTYSVRTKYNYTANTANSLCGNFESGTGKASFGQIYLTSDTSAVYSGIGNTPKVNISLITINTDYTDEFTIDTSKGTITRTLNGTTMTETGLNFGTRSDRHSLLFACNTNSGASQFGREKIYYFQILKDGTPVREFVPVKRNSDNELGMYDLVSGQFFTNQGTGTFTAGNTVSDPVEIYTDGTVETIRVGTKNLLNTATSESGKYIDEYGQLAVYEPWYASDFIQVSPNTNYYFQPNSTVGGSAKHCYYDANKNFISCVNSGPALLSTPSNCKYVRVSYRDTSSDVQLEQGSTATAYVPYFNGGTATAEMLLKVGTYTDEQEVISGTVTRKVDIKVFDGTENWTYYPTQKMCYINTDLGMTTDYQNAACLSTHFKNVSYSQGTATPYQDLVCFPSMTSFGIVCFRNTAFTTADDFKNYFAQQYANGTPVIMVYQLATATTKSVAGQPMATTQGDNIAEITQASIDGLELQVTYEKEA